MLTGVLMARHHISWNDWQPQRGLVTTLTIFKLVRERGYTKALFAGKEKFRYPNVPGTLDEFQIPGYSAKVVPKAAAKYIVEKKPNLCFVHFADSDGAGHAHGWDQHNKLSLLPMKTKRSKFCTMR
jgi:hypothetical protein